MPKFASQIRTSRIPVEGLTAESSDTPPGSPTEGLLWHDTANKQYKIFLNGQWVRSDNQGVASASHIHAIADVTGLSAVLDSKASASHTHTTSQINGLDSQLSAMSSDTNSRALKSTTISPGTGLTGGGDLSANRTLAVDTNTIATKTYVDGVAQGLKTRTAVRVATTANITLSGTQTVDGVALTAGNRVLVKNQTDSTKNGIYTVASGAWTRTDLDAVDGNFWFVQEGSTQESSGWVLTTNGAIVWGTSSIAFSQFSGAGSVNAGDGLAKDGNVLRVLSGSPEVVVSPSGVSLSENVSKTLSSAVQILEISLPALTAGSWSANLIPTNNDVTLRIGNPSIRSVNDGEEIELDVKIYGTNDLRVRSDLPYSAGALKAFVPYSNVKW